MRSITKQRPSDEAAQHYVVDSRIQSRCLFHNAEPYLDYFPRWRHMTSENSDPWATRHAIVSRDNHTFTPKTQERTACSCTQKNHKVKKNIFREGTGCILWHWSLIHTDTWERKTKWVGSLSCSITCVCTHHPIPVTTYPTAQTKEPVWRPGQANFLRPMPATLYGKASHYTCKWSPSRRRSLMTNKLTG